MKEEVDRYVHLRVVLVAGYQVYDTSLACGFCSSYDTLYEYGMSVQTPTNCCYKVHAFTTAVSNENGHVVLLLNVLEGYGTTAVLQDCP